MPCLASDGLAGMKFVLGDGGRVSAMFESCVVILQVRLLYLRLFARGVNQT